MELLQLRYFYESAGHENFAKTAEKFMVPTSSVSASVKRLEKELGTPLFDRTSNRITLNKAGKEFQKALHVALGELDRAVEKITSPDNDTREIKMLVRALRSTVTDCIIEYSARYPQAVFKTVFDFSETNFSEYDIIIDEKSDRFSGYESFEIANLRLRLTAAANNPLAGKKLWLKQLHRQPFISIGEQSNMQNILIKACKKAGFTPNIAVQSNDITCLNKLIESDIGIGLTREIPKKEKPPKITYLDVVDFNEHYNVYAYYKKQTAYGTVERFLNFLQHYSI